MSGIITQTPAFPQCQFVVKIKNNKGKWFLFYPKISTLFLTISISDRIIN